MKFIWVSIFLVVEVFALIFFYHQKNREIDTYVNSMYVELKANYKAFLRQYQKLS